MAVTYGNNRNDRSEHSTNTSRNEAKKSALGRANRWGARACPRALVAKRVYVRIREKEGFTHPSLWRAPCFWGTYEWELHAVDT